MSEREEMFSGNDVEESSSSLGYSPSDYSVPSEGFQELVEQTNTYRGITDQGQGRKWYSLAGPSAHISRWRDN